MTTRQSLIMWVGIIIIVLTTIFPPVLKTVTVDENNVASYRQVVEHEYLFTKSLQKICLERLLIEWFLILVVICGLLITFK